MLIETSRLQLREFRVEDAANMYDLNSDIEVVQYTGDASFESVAASRKFLKSYDAYEKHNMGRWLVSRKSDQACLGWCGLKMHEGNWVDLGYRFFKKYWNMGYATESSKGCIAYGFGALGLTEIYATVLPINKASSRVLEKLGFQFFKEIEDEFLGNCFFYELRKENWIKDERQKDVP